MMISHVHKPEPYMGCSGTKFGYGPYNWTPATLGEMYQKVIEELGECQLNKPVPGHSYRKMYKPVQHLDTGVFKRLPQEIIITQPARLFRSRSWKYKGVIYGEVDVHWKFQYKTKRICTLPENTIDSEDSRLPVWDYDKTTGDFRFLDEWEYDWMPIFLLSNCYINQTLTFHKLIQLTLF